MKRLLLLLLCVSFATFLEAQSGTYRIKRGGQGFNLPAPEGYIAVGVGGTSWVLAETDCVLDTVPDPPTFTCSGSGALYSTIQNEGTDLTQRNKLNFIGALVNCADDAGNARTNCTFTTPSNALLDASSHTDTTASAVTRCDLVYGNSTPAWDDLSCTSLLSTTATHILGTDGTDIGYVPSIPPSVMFNPKNGWYEYDEFTCVLSNFTTGSANICEGWWRTAINSGRLDSNVVETSYPSSDMTNHPGVIATGTAGVGTGRSGICNGAAITNDQGTMVFEGGEIVATWLFYIPTLSTAGDPFTISIGFMDNIDTNNPPVTQGVWLEYTHSVNSGKFEFRGLDAGAATTEDTGVTVAANTWYEAQIQIAANGDTAKLYINAVLKNTLDEPGGEVVPDSPDPLSACMWIAKGGAGTANVTARYDYFWIYQKFTTPR